MTQTTPRITHRTRGTQRGFLRRMVSPGDLGEVMKPFIFLDHIHGPIAPGTGFGWHPHSGLATLTYSLNSDAAYEDTAGQHGLVEATGLEWMRAGGGTWHQGFLHPREATVTSFQLWVALPPGVEDGPPEGLYVAPTEVPQVGAVRVLLGEFGGQRSPIPTPSPLTYLDVALAVGATWAYAPPDDHDVLWAFVYRGRARIAGELIAGELVVLAGGAGALRSRSRRRRVCSSGRPRATPTRWSSATTRCTPTRRRWRVARPASARSATSCARPAACEVPTTKRPAWSSPSHGGDDAMRGVGDDQAGDAGEQAEERGLAVIGDEQDRDRGDVDVAAGDEVEERGEGAAQARAA